jgi:hypothetical protein
MAPAPITADLVGRVMVAAARRMNVDPLSLFDNRPGRSGARVLAACALAPLVGSAKAARVCQVAFPQQQAPSQWPKAAIVRADIDAVTLAIPELAAARAAPTARRPPPEPRSRPPSSRPGAAAANVTPLAYYLKPKAARAPVTHPSSRSGARTAACDLPGREKGLSERDARLAAQEHEFVMSKREAGVPWSHIAQQLAVGVTALRRRHDPEFAG